MNRDEIITEVRNTREQLAARHNYNVRELYEEAKKRQQQSERKTVKLAPRQQATITKNDS